jgi:hypothetical protein
MYNDHEAEQIHRIASDAIDSTQASITEISNLHGSTRTKAVFQILDWQKWLGNIAFTLAAIGAALVLGKPINSYYVPVALVGFLVVGTWIAIHNKNHNEQVLASLNKIYNEPSQLQHNRKKAAYMMWKHPADPKNRLAFLKIEKKIMDVTLRNERQHKADYEKQQINYLSDLWIALVVVSTYLLLRPLFEQFFDLTTLDARKFFELGYWGFLTLILGAILYYALKSSDAVIEDNKLAIKNKKEQIRHTRGYRKEVEEEITAIKTRFNIQ